MTAMIKPDSALHLVGIGGIGMSGLAQMCRALGCRVSGSDRALNNPENQRIFAALRAQGIALYPQDGSGVKAAAPDFLIYSTAIEDDNPDFKAAGNAARLHRSEAMAQAMALNRQDMIAITGSCGKTTVTSWLAETLARAGFDPSFLSGGLVNSFRRPDLAGNYCRGKGRFMVFEADESDKSLLAYQPEYAMVTNIGTDHYSKEELIEVFRRFLGRVRIGAVIERRVADLLEPDCMRHLKVVTFSECSGATDADWTFADYCGGASGCSAVFSGCGRIELPLPGEHNAANMAALLAAFALLGLDPMAAARAATDFGGVWRRFDYAGNTSAGAAVYDDYAHNVEKIISCIRAARQLCSGRVLAVFQPHGFGPLKFMREEFLTALRQELRPDDRLLLLPVYYAGGTTSFSPTSAEVADGYRRGGLTNCQACSDRAEASGLIRQWAGSDDIVLVMGARDNSLSDWAAELTCQKPC